LTTNQKIAGSSPAERARESDRFAAKTPTDHPISCHLSRLLPRLVPQRDLQNPLIARTLSAGSEENLDQRTIRAFPRRVRRLPTPIRFVAFEEHDRRSHRSLCAAVPVRLCILGGKWLKAAYLVYLGANTLLWKRTLSSCPDEDRYRHECQHVMVRWNQE
jgi:hypothetical protein